MPGNGSFPKPGRYGLSLEVASLGVQASPINRHIYFKVGAANTDESAGKDNSL